MDIVKVLNFFFFQQILLLVYVNYVAITGLVCSDKHDTDALRSLEEKARQYDGMGHRTMLLCSHFYRDKYLSQWQTSPKHHMIPYTKDMNGDPRNPINGRDDIKGIYFNAHVCKETGKPIEPSLFGNCRLPIHAAVFLNHMHNMFFSDFYCLTERKAHYVTLVICRRGSKEDMICRNLLVKLDMCNNPFLCIKGVSYYVSKTLWVEVFYATSDPVDITMYEHNMHRVDCKYPESLHLTLRGKYKTKDCKICNIQN